MRRYSVTEGSTDDVLAELNQAGTDRTAQGREDKARDIARAALAVEIAGYGTEVVVGAHSLYRAAGPREPRRYLTVEDAKASILTELQGLADFHGDERPEFGRAIAAIKYGATAVFVDGVRYHVITA
jgi:hypothetical protein